MTIRIRMLLVSTFFIITAFNQKSTDDKIFWIKDKKLVWDNFKAIPDNNNKHGAITSSGYGYAPYKIKNDSVILLFATYFIKNESWVKEYAKTTAMLKHEQCHFDITELYSRKFKKIIINYKFSKNSFRETYKMLFNKSLSEWQACQDLYDKETDHSKISLKQLEWEKKVAKDLKELEIYSDATVKLYLNN